MGEVFRAYDTKLNRPIAIKVMRRVGEADLSIARFLREARAASALNHPNIWSSTRSGKPARGSTSSSRSSSRGPRCGRCWRPASRRCRWPRSSTSAARPRARSRRRMRPGSCTGTSSPRTSCCGPTVTSRCWTSAWRAPPIRRGTPESQTAHLATAPGVVMGTAAYMSPGAGDRGERRAGARHVLARHRALRDGGRAAAVQRRRPRSPSSPASSPNSRCGRRVQRRECRARSTTSRCRCWRRTRRSGPPPARWSGADRARPARSCSATWPRRRDGRAPPSAATPSGRELLRSLRAASRPGAASSSRSAGEPGIGKTSLVEDFLAELAAHGEHPTVDPRGKLFRAAGRRGGVPADSRGARQPAARGHDGRRRCADMTAVAPTWYLQVAPLPARHDLDRGSCATVPRRHRRSG